jgi:hypothetical protein
MELHIYNEITLLKYVNQKVFCTVIKKRFDDIDFTKFYFDTLMTGIIEKFENLNLTHGEFKSEGNCISVDIIDDKSGTVFKLILEHSKTCSIDEWYASQVIDETCNNAIQKMEVGLCHK